MKDHGRKSQLSLPKNNCFGIVFFNSENHNSFKWQTLRRGLKKENRKVFVFYQSATVVNNPGTSVAQHNKCMSRSHYGSVWVGKPFLITQQCQPRHVDFKVTMVAGRVGEHYSCSYLSLLEITYHFHLSSRKNLSQVLIQLQRSHLSGHPVCWKRQNDLGEHIATLTTL